ncbi:hypothetical protein [Phaeospirillum tilakii]|uniref:GDSL-like Lipase/Acylhydrolase n=1 Tax=Phaeospirillum tilakii TaxID=741673 RepID=A0ABW5CDH2_9PROT
MIKYTITIVAGLVLLANLAGIPFEFKANPSEIQKISGELYKLKLPVIFRIADVSTDNLDEIRSTLILRESGIALGPAHVLHDDIRRLGGGRYSHWGKSLLFSSSDHSDPRFNTHDYAITARLFPPIWLNGLAMVVVCWSLFRGLRPTGSAHWVTRMCRPTTLRGTVLLYSGIFAAATGMALTLHRPWQVPAVQPVAGGDRGVIERAAFYRQASGRYDLVFLGDSRTYCGIHPELIDPILGTHSINLAQFSNWFPTQYPLVRDLIPHIKPGTIVVWSIGHQNFYSGTSTQLFYNMPLLTTLKRLVLGKLTDGADRKSPFIQRVYPIPPLIALQYLFWNVPTNGLGDNVAFFSPLLRAFTKRDETRDDIYRWLNRDLVALPSPESPPESPPGSLPLPTQDRDAWVALTGRFPEASIVENRDQGHLVSLTAFLAGGGYYRVEIDPAFFRRKQAEMGLQPIDDAQALSQIIPEPDAGLLRLFDTILATFQDAGIPLIVNELEEAPFVYRNPIVRDKWRAFMRERIEPRVRAAGFPYVRTDLSTLKDDDYFDWDHLNQKGMEKYTPMIAESLRPFVDKNEPRHAF